jgi:hypothetical protein
MPKEAVAMYCRAHIGLWKNLVYLTALTLLCFSIVVQAQSNLGTIRGTARDQSGAVVPNAKITVTNVATGIQTPTKTNESGEYNVEFLQPGNYTVEAQLAGFKAFARSGILVETAKLVRADVLLETGDVSQSVEVSAQSTQVDTDSSMLTTSVNNTLLTELPISNRDPRSTMALIPGSTGGSGASVNGGVARLDPYFVDGVNAVNQVYGTVNIQPNIDTVEEFRVLTNSYSAEYGSATGAVTIAVMKSGTNTFHGNLFEFWQNDILNAGNYFTHERAKLRHNQFGGTVGGPIIRNKTFFFFDMQIQKEPSTRIFNNVTVPVEAYRRGDFSSLLQSTVIGTDALGNPVQRGQIYDPFSARQVTNSAGQLVWVRDRFTGNIIPASRISNAAQKIQAFFPTPTAGGATNNYTGAGSGRNDIFDWDIKVDHNFNASNRLTARYSSHHWDQPAASVYGDSIANGPVGNHYMGTGRQSSVNYVKIFGSSATNSLILSNANQYPTRDQMGQGVISPNDLGIFGMPNGAEKVGFPTISFTNFQSIGSGAGTLFRELQNQNDLTDTFSLIKGRHNMKFGGQILLVATNNFQPSSGGLAGSFSFNLNMTNQPGFTNTGYDYASFLMGTPQNFTYTLFPDFFRTRSRAFGVFFQDDYHVSRKLTLNLGLRWDLPEWYHEAQDRSGIYSLTAGRYLQFGQNGFRRTLYNQDYNNFAPRVGFAYNLFGDDQKMVLRAGYGISYIGLQQAGSNGLLPFSPIFADGDVGRYSAVDNVNFKTTLDNIPYVRSDQFGANASSVNVYPDEQPLGYYEQWNVNIQKEIKGTLIQAGYVGSHGIRIRTGASITGAYNLNAIPVALAPVARGRFIAPYVPYPQFPSGVNYQAGIANSDYNALQIQVQRRLSHGFTFLTAFTHMKQITIGDAGYRDPVGNRNLDRGPTGNPDRFTASFSYTLPYQPWFGKSFLSNAIGGWALSGIVTLQSGSLLTVGTSTNPCVCGNSASTANISGDPNEGFTQSVDEWFNTSVFSQPEQYTIGNSGRGIIVGPSSKNFDVAMAKQFALPWHEGMKLQFRAELFNAFNTVNLSNPNVRVGSATFGQITNVGSRRTGQLGMKLNW